MTTKTIEKTDTKTIEKLLNSIDKVSKKEVAVSVRKDNSINKKIIKLHGEYTQMFATTLFQSIMEFNLSKNDLIVLFGYCSVLEYGNAINISQQDISDLTGIARPHVARSVKKLKDIGIFYSTDRAPRSMYIHPAFIAKGDLSQFKEKIEEWEVEKRGKKAEKIKNKDQIEEKKDDDLPF